MSAPKRFALGQRVRLTKEALAMGLKGRATSEYGTVVGFSRLSYKYVRVLRDGLKRSDSYSVNFWRSAP